MKSKTNCFTVKVTKKYGRGLYASRNIKRGDIVEMSPVLVVDKYDAGKINDTLVNVYVFEWNKESSALAFGYGSLFNHSKKPNVTYMNSFQSREILFMASKDIKKGEQLFINYGYEPEYGIQTTQRNKAINLGKENKNAKLGPVFAAKNRIEPDAEDGFVKEKPGFEN